MHLLLGAYLLGVIGTLWDWREHFLGVSTQAPHLVIDAGGLLAIGVLAFTDWDRIRGRTLAVFYLLLVVVMIILLGPFVLMVAAPHSELMTSFMRAGMTRSALGLYLPIVMLATATTTTPRAAAIRQALTGASRSQRQAAQVASSTIGR